MSSIGLDIGGTFLKAAYLGVPSNELQVFRRPIPTFVSVDGVAREIAAEQLVDACRELIVEVAADSPEFDGIRISGQMAGLAFLSERGEPVAPVISWQDSRGTEPTDLEVELGGELLHRMGDGLRRGHPLTKLRAGLAPKGAFVTSLLGMVASSLCGARVASLHASDLAALGLYDVDAKSVSAQVIGILPIDASLFPKPCDGHSPIGNELLTGKPVFAPVGDQQASLLGVGIGHRDLSVNLATGCQVSTLRRPSDLTVQRRPFFGDQILYTHTHLPAGRLLQESLDRDFGHKAGEEEWAAFTREPNTFSHGYVALQEIATTIAARSESLVSEDVNRVVFSGGLVQRIPHLQHEIARHLHIDEFRVYEGDDSALAGLRIIDQAL